MFNTFCLWATVAIAGSPSALQEQICRRAPAKLAIRTISPSTHADGRDARRDLPIAAGTLRSSNAGSDGKFQFGALERRFEDVRKSIRASESSNFLTRSEVL